MDILVTIADWFVTVTNYFLSIPIENYISIVVILIGVAGVSAVTQVLKKALKLTSDKKIVALFTSVSLVATLLVTLINSAEVNPLLLGEHTAAVMGIALPLYKFFIKPLSLIIAQFQVIRTPLEQKLAEIDVEIPQHVIDEAKKMATPETEVAVTNEPVIALTQNTAVTVPEGTVILTDPEAQAKKEVIADF